MFDVILWCTPLVLPPVLWRMLPAARRRVLCRDLPFGMVLALAAALAVGWNAAAALGAAMPWSGTLRFAGYVAVWLLALRLLRGGLAALVRRCRLSPLPASTLATLATFALGMPHLYVALQTHRIAVPCAPSPARGEARDVAFRTDDGVLLRGTLLTQAGSAPVVVVCHGVGANRAAFFAYADWAFELGCHALAFDFRAHGGSDGTISTFGHDEVRDVVAAVTWLRNQPDLAAAPVVLVGVSMGGAAVLRAAPQVGAAAVFTESAFASLVDMVDAETAALGPLRGIAHTAIAWAAQWQLGVDLRAVSPEDSLAALPASVPVVLVHAGDDRVIPVAAGRQLAAARTGQELRVVGGAAHGGCTTAAPGQMRAWLAGLLADVRRNGARMQPRGG